MRPRRWPAPGLALLLVACSTSAASTPPASPQPSEAASPTATVPSAAASAEPIAELEATGEALPPGRYTRSGFEPRITIELDRGWEAVQLRNGFWDVQQRVGTPDVIAVQFANVLQVYGAQGVAAEADGHADAVEILAANPNLEVVESSESQIGGLTGSQVTVDNSGTANASVIAVAPGALGIDPGRRLWIAFFDTDAGLLAIMVGGSVAEWQAALYAAEPVLESVTIGP